MIPRFSCKCSLTSATTGGLILAVAAAAVLHKLNSCCLVQTALKRGKTSANTLQISPGPCTTLHVPSRFQWPHINLHEWCVHTWKVLWAQLCFVLKKGALRFLFALYSAVLFTILWFFQPHFTMRSDTKCCRTDNVVKTECNETWQTINESPQSAARLQLKETLAISRE